jgi:hypothetical protein
MAKIEFLIGGQSAYVKLSTAAYTTTVPFTKLLQSCRFPADAVSDRQSF